MKKFLLFGVLCGFVLSNQAYAEIVYTGSIVTVPDAMGSGNITIDIAGDAAHWDDFTVQLIDLMGPPSGQVLSINGPSTSMGMDIVGLDLAGFNTLAVPLFPGELISSSMPFTSNAVLYSSSPSTGIVGLFGPSIVPPIGLPIGVSSGYIGLKMTPLTSVPYYGWLHMSSMSDIGLPTFSATFDGWAYENTGAPIAAGAVPIPGAFLLGSIGLGCAGWLCKRLRV